MAPPPSYTEPSLKPEGKTTSTLGQTKTRLNPHWNPEKNNLDPQAGKSEAKPSLEPRKTTSTLRQAKTRLNPNNLHNQHLLRGGVGVGVTDIRPGCFDRLDPFLTGR